MDRFKAGEGHGPIRASPSLEPSRVSDPRWWAMSGLQRSVPRCLEPVLVLPLTHSPRSYAPLSPSAVFKSHSSLGDPV